MVHYVSCIWDHFLLSRFWIGLFIFLGWLVGSWLYVVLVFWYFFRMLYFFGNIFFGLLYLVLGIFFLYLGKTSTVL